MSESTKDGGVLKRVFAAFLPGDGASPGGKESGALPQAYGSVKRLAELMAERQRLGRLRDAELERKRALQQRLADLDRQRIEALTELRATGEAAHKDLAEGLLKQCEALRQEIKDADAVAAGIEGKIGALGPEFETLKRVYANDLGAFLGTVYQRLAQRYNDMAPQVADLALQIAAVQNVMLRYRTGNTNGFERRIYLPRIVPGEGRTLRPHLDADTIEFVRGANERSEAIFAEMKAAGFIWRFD